MSWHGIEAYKMLMAMLVNSPGDPLATQTFHRVAQMLPTTWSDRHDRGGRRDFHFEGDCNYYLARFVIKLPLEEARAVIQPLITAVDGAPKELAAFIEQLIGGADALDSSGCFWQLWSEFGNGILNASWLSRLEARYPGDDGLLRAMFLGISWKKGVTHWRHSEGKAQLLDSFFSKLPAVPAVFSAYTSFLSHVGDRSLPHAFIILQQQLRTRNATKVLSDSNTVFYLESLLKRFVYGKPAVLKQDDQLREAVLFLLDQLVEAGSSTAYRMRDDFVTPGSGE